METTAALLRRIFDPESVAVVGASSATAKFGGRLMHSLLQHGHAGRIGPASPSVPHVPNLQAYLRVGAALGRASEDARDGVAALKAMRKPSFKGR